MSSYSHVNLFIKSKLVEDIFGFGLFILIRSDSDSTVNFFYFVFCFFLRVPCFWILGLDQRSVERISCRIFKFLLLLIRLLLALLVLSSFSKCTCVCSHASSTRFDALFCFFLSPSFSCLVSFRCFPHSFSRLRFTRCVERRSTLRLYSGVVLFIRVQFGQFYNRAFFLFVFSLFSCYSFSFSSCSSVTTFPRPFNEHLVLLLPVLIRFAGVFSQFCTVLCFVSLKRIQTDRRSFVVVLCFF